MKKRLILAFLICLALLFCSCSDSTEESSSSSEEEQKSQSEAQNEIYKELGAYDGYFEGESDSFTVECISGTPNAHKYENGTLTFTSQCAGGVYSISGQLKGKIVFDVGENGKIELEMHGFSLVNTVSVPISVKSADKVTLIAKKDFKNYIYDKSPLNAGEGAIFSDEDLEISGKGSLVVMSDNSAGIYSKKDLKIKNLSLLVISEGNAVRGNDSVGISYATLKAVSGASNGIKTTKSDVSSSGNQRGGVVIAGSTVEIYSALDGIEAAYDVVVNGADTRLSIYTDKYSSFSEDAYEISKDVYYIRAMNKNYKYSVKYVKDNGEYKWENAQYHSSTSDGKNPYFYYSFPKNVDYDKLQFFIYSDSMEQAQETECIASSDFLTINGDYDTIALYDDDGALFCNWTAYTTGGGGMHAGNTDRTERSTKGIKAGNKIVINAGNILIKSYDDAIHAQNTEALENGKTPVGSVTISSGKLEIYSNDDGIHADGEMQILGGEISIKNSYEGIEGLHVKISGASLTVFSKDDAINATAPKENAISIENSKLYIFCSGDGIDSNSATSYEGIIFKGAEAIIITTSAKNSAIDAENGYTSESSKIVAIMPHSGNVGETASAKDFESIGVLEEMSFNAGQCLIFDWQTGISVIKSPCTLSAYIVLVSDTEASVSVSDTTDKSLDSDGICWYIGD